MVQSVVDLVRAKPRSFENVEKVSDSNFHVPFLHPNAPEAKEIQKTINGVIDQSFKIVPVFKGEWLLSETFNKIKKDIVSRA